MDDAVCGHQRGEAARVHTQLEVALYAECAQVDQRARQLFWILV